MKKYIVKRIKEKIEILRNDWADNFISKAYNDKLGTDEAKEFSAKNELNMIKIEENIASLNTMLKEHETK